MKDAVKEAATTNRSQTIIMALIAVLGGAGAGTGIQFSPAHRDGDVTHLEREIAELGELEREVEDLEEKVDDLRDALNEERRNRLSHVQGVARDLRSDINRVSSGGGSSGTSALDYYMLNEPAAAAEAAPEVELSDPEPE